MNNTQTTASASAEPTTIDLEAKRLKPQADLLEALEADIADGLKSFYKVGKALAHIRDERLYKGSYADFNTYCRERWDMVASRARQFCAAASVVDDLKLLDTARNSGTVTIVTPESEAQCRPLMKLDTDQRCEAWKRALELADGKRVTAKVVQEAATSVEREAMDPRMKRIEELTDRISAALIKQLEAGQALKRIRDTQSYKTVGSPSFEVYCKDHLDFPPEEAVVLINAATLAERGTNPKFCVGMATSMRDQGLKGYL